MPELSESITAIRDGAKEERFTYLTILEYHIKTPGVLPTLDEVLQNADLTSEIGWDLVQMLIGVDGYETCLETVARLGNPREVIIKVMETLAVLAKPFDEDQDDDEPDKAHFGLKPSEVPGRLISLISVLAILQRRIKTKHPSRFLGPSLVSVLEAYQPTPEVTAAVINLVRSLSGRVRPPLPTRTSSINVANPDEHGDVSKNAPDPEAEQEAPKEESLKQRLLQSFTTCILQRYVNVHGMQWSRRLLEVYQPGRIIPGRMTAMQAFREDETLQKRDAVVGQLVALLGDLGIDDCSTAFVREVLCHPNDASPLPDLENFDSVDDIHLSQGGAACLIAYWIFSTDAFDADSPDPAMHLFPDHLDMLRLFLGTDPNNEITNNPGVADALLAIGLGLHHRGLISAKETEDNTYMAYHHFLTLIALFHPDIQIRNAATRFAGTLLHADPDDESRLDILQDLLENCQYASLKACAVQWLQEEIVLAQKESKSNIFSKPEVIEKLQYEVFPDAQSTVSLEKEDILQYWGENRMFILQVANFAYFLFNGRKDLVPAGMDAAVGQRFVEPLIAATTKLRKVDGLDEHEQMQLDVLGERLQGLNIR
ncbi:hypothetical protein NPX13_g10795 [Xylaria arbuscula]|uniref:DUF1760-domain-containing protein n=1 Tax=Xylaria arbuscula TaxID=114810 RepID=A0A9W8N3W8_9PEZI|nr:hypothetical protein NPX13_g10795 [Xylaria arbuscula]